MSRKLGFSGASGGATSDQLRRLRTSLADSRRKGFDEFHHGLCIGADEQAAEIAKELGFRIVAHPGSAGDPLDLEYRSSFCANDEVLEAKPFAVRDRDIVDVSERLVAVPSTQFEELDSGTWATVRYAQKQKRPIKFILPDSGKGCAYAKLGHKEISGVTQVSPKQVVQEWVSRFNSADIDGLISLYAANATNHQVVMEPLVGRDAIRKMFLTEFGRAKMTCVVENLFEDGDWAILEWRDTTGLRGCGFFHVRNGEIVFQRGYFDQLSFFKLQGIAVPSSYLGG
jgi:limonene-1,2-epoxide hydrolase